MLASSINPSVKKPDSRYARDCSIYAGFSEHYAPCLFCSQSEKLAYMLIFGLAFKVAQVSCGLKYHQSKLNERRPLLLCDQSEVKCITADPSLMSVRKLHTPRSSSYAHNSADAPTTQW